MKCKNCGGEVDSRAVCCPYCGSENQEGILYQEQVRNKLERYRFLKPFILKQKTPEMISKYMTRLLAVLAGINALVLGISFLLFCAGEWIVRPAVPVSENYSGGFGDYTTGSFYVGMNACMEKLQNAELPTQYEIEEVIESGGKVLAEAEDSDEKDIKEQELLATVFLTEYLGLTEEDTDFLREQMTEKSYMDNRWLSDAAKKVLKIWEDEAE